MNEMIFYAAAHQTTDVLVARQYWAENGKGARQSRSFVGKGFTFASVEFLCFVLITVSNFTRITDYRDQNRG